MCNIRISRECKLNSPKHPQSGISSFWSSSSILRCNSAGVNFRGVKSLSVGLISVFSSLGAGFVDDANSVWLGRGNRDLPVDFIPAEADIPLCEVDGMTPGTGMPGKAPVHMEIGGSVTPSLLCSNLGSLDSDFDLSDL